MELVFLGFTFSSSLLIHFPGSTRLLSVDVPSSNEIGREDGVGEVSLSLSLLPVKVFFVGWGLNYEETSWAAIV